jgi:hypothetical protein
MASILVFNHIKKTAGSSLRHVLFNVYGGRHVHVLYVYKRSRIRTWEEHLALLNEKLSEARPRITAVVSHAGYGVHEHLPEQHRYPQFTMLRDPVERTISMYYFVIQNGVYPPDTPIEVFLQDTARAYNTQTADLGGLMVRTTVGGQPMRREDFDEALLARAKANLLAHDVFGLTERFEESLVLASAALGWPPRRLAYKRRNVGKARRVRAALTPQQVELVREHNRLDLALYAFALDHFERRLEEAPDHARRLRALGRANRLQGFSARSLHRRLRNRARRAARAIGLR